MSISLINLLAASFGLWILFKFGLSPFAGRMTIRDKSPAAFKKYVFRNIVGFGSLFFLLTTISSVISWIVVKFISLKGGETLGELQESMAAVKKIEAMTSLISLEFAVGSTILLGVALIILTYKSTKSSFNEIIEQAFSEELERLQKDLDEGNWEELPPTDEMVKADELISEYSDRIEEIEAQEVSDESVAELNAIKEGKEKLTEFIQQVDLQRRINIRVEEEDEIKPETTKGKILLFFASQGLFNTLKKGSSILFIVGVLLLIPSLLSIGATIVDQKVRTKIATLDTVIENLELKIQKRELAEEFDNIVVSESNIDDETDESQPDSLSAEDEQVLNELSSFFENEIVAIRVVGRAAASFNSNRGLTNYAVRSKILDEFAGPGKKATVHKADAVSGLAQDAVDLEKRALSRDEPITKLGQRIKDDLADVAKKDKKLWLHYKDVVKKTTRSFQVPASARNIKGMMISNVIGHLAQGAEIPGATGKLVGNLSKVPGDIAEQFYINESRRYMIELSKAQSLEEVAQKIEKAKYRAFPKKTVAEFKTFSNNIPRGEHLSKVLTENPPTLVRLTEADIKINKAQNTITKIARLNNSLNAPNFADALSSFGDYFPGYEGQERRTAKGKAVSKVSKPKPNVSYKKTFTRARSYVRLRGFARIGGVLIGRMPDGDDIIKIKDFSWEKMGKKYGLSVVLEDGKQIGIGAFNPAIMHLAIGYAADGRVTTVTMVSSDPLFDLKILLHPTLVDTGLGCRAIRLDQFADETTSENEVLKQMRSDENQKIQNAKILYSYAWALRLIDICRANPDIVSEIQNYLDFAKRIVQNNRQAILTILNGKKECNFDFLSSNMEFYDMALVKMINQCAKPSDFESCILDNSPFATSLNNPEWLFPPPETTVWSGVREREYTLDQELEFILAQKHDELWPFRFMVQTVFTSAPEFLSDENKDFITRPWEFDSVNQVLMENIKSNLSKKPKLRSIFKDMKEFAVLQRFFRLALNNRFGDDFPIEKLVLLAKETKSYSYRYNRTLKWLPKPWVISELEKELASQKGDVKEEKEFLAMIKQLRLELGVHKDEEQIYMNGGKECPEP